jgi:cell wall-associated NlpC family hydrolase
LRQFFNLNFGFDCVVKTLTYSSENDLPLFKLTIISAAFAILSGCAGDMDIKPEPAPRPVTKHSVNAPVVDYALQFQGAPYSYGNASPEKGFDCSGFVKYVYDQNGVYLPRTVREMSNVLTPVPNENIHSGDLVFFNTTGGDFASHVGIYTNSNNFIHAPSSKTGKVVVSSLKTGYWRERFIDARRPYKTH